MSVYVLNPDKARELTPLEKAKRDHEIALGSYKAPEEMGGAPISGWFYEGYEYFTKETPFKPGDIYKFEDDLVGYEFLNTFGFLREMTPTAAKEHLASKLHTCKKCDFQTRTPISLANHAKEHTKEEELDVVGIPVMRKAKSMREKLEEETKHVTGDKQAAIEAKAASESGLNDGYGGLTEGEGLIIDRSV